MKNILIRTLGGGDIGYGHFYRCLSLYKAISYVCSECNIIFLINDNLIDLVEKENISYIISNSLLYDLDKMENMNIDLLILDTYLGDNNYIKSIKKKTKVMLIDDNNDIYDSAIIDIIYNGNIHSEKLSYPHIEGQMRLVGMEYLIMKEEYSCIEENNKIDKSGVLVTTGGSDNYGISMRIMDVLKALDTKVKVIIGPGYTDEYVERLEEEKNDNIEFIYSPSSLKRYIRESKVVITAAGSTIYEVLSQKSIPIIFSLVGNQDLICKDLKSRSIFCLGKYPNIDYLKIIDIIDCIDKDKDKVDYSDIFNIVDGKGALRVARLILSQI